MTLLHVSPYYAPAWAYGGVVRAVTQLTRTQAARGHRVFVLTTDTLSPSRRIAVRHDQLDGVHVTRVANASNAARGRLNLSTPLGFVAAARRLLREQPIGLVHCHELRTVETVCVAAIASRLGVPVVLTPHGTLPYETGNRAAKRLWDRLLGPWLLRRIDQVVALTAAEAADVRALWARLGVTRGFRRSFVRSPSSPGQAPNGGHSSCASAGPSIG